MKRRVRLAIVMMGFSGLVAEILLLRELLIVFSGNELSIGIVLANWLIAEALGCFFPGRLAEKPKNRLEAYAALTVLFSLALVTAVFLTRGLKGALGISIGERLGLVPMFYSSLILVFPASMLHGALFTFSCRIYSMVSGEDAATAGRVYVYETVGTILGGIAATYLLVPYLNAVQASVGLAVLNAIVCIVLLTPHGTAGRFRRGVLVGLSALVVWLGWLLVGGAADRLHLRSIQAQWKDLEIVHYQNSPYGNISVVENEGQYIFFQDGIATLITPVPDVISVEEFVHLPLLAHPEPARVLILSGGAGGVIDEVRKHPSVVFIEYAELDPLLLALLERFPTPLTRSELHDRRVKLHHVDGRLFLRSTPNTYDVIFVGVEPSNLQTNRFFTREFFSLAKTRLNEGGVLVVGVPASLTLMSLELRDLNGSVFHSLDSVFSHVRVIPGDDRNIFLASESTDIAALDKAQVIARLSERKIAARVMVPWHIENKLHQGWQDWFAELLREGSQEINRDFRPVGVFYSVAHWHAVFAPAFGRLFRQFERIDVGTILAVFVLWLLVYFFLRSRGISVFRASIPFAIITSGFAGMMFDLVLIFAFQSIYGYVFSWVGLLVASFMAGAACGAMLMPAILTRMRDEWKLFVETELAVLCLSLVLPLIILATNAIAGSWSEAVLLPLFLVVAFVCGALPGSQFPLANKLSLKNGRSVARTGALLYASDLAGGWLGGIAGAVVLLPVLGLTGTCVAVGLAKLASLMVIVTQPNPHVRGGR